MISYNKFTSKIHETILGQACVVVEHYKGNVLQQTVDGKVFVNHNDTTLSSLEEAKEYIEQRQLQADIQKKIQEELYQEIKPLKIAEIIKTHHNVSKVTDTLIENYIELASSKVFTLDPVVVDIRNNAKQTYAIEGMLDFTLDDGSTVVISEETFRHINKVLANHPDTVKQIRSSVNCFLDAVNAIKD